MGNLRGIALMTGGMGAFAVGDLLLKIAVEFIPVAQIIMVTSLGSLVIFLGLAWINGQTVLDRKLLAGPVYVRNLAEVVGTFAITTGLALSELSTATALMQTVPLVALAGAVLFLGERVGWRRWASVAVGLLGVIVIIRPAGGVEPGLLFILLGVLGLAARDLATRQSDPAIPSVVLSVWSFASLLPVSLLWLWAGGGGVWPDAVGWVLLTGLTLGVALAFFLVTASMRQGEVSAIIPFRYTRLLFALVFAIVFLGERPDIWVYVGAALIIGSGLYALWRERAAAGG